MAVSKHNFIWLTRDSNLVGHWSASKISGQAAWPGEHTLTMSCFEPQKFTHKRAGTHVPNPKWNLIVLLQNDNVIWCFFQLLPSSDQPCVPRLAWPLVGWWPWTLPWWLSVPPQMVGQWHQQQLDGDTTHDVPKFGPLVGLAHVVTRQWGSAQVGGDVTLWSCHHPQHQAPFPQKQPDLAQDSSWSNSRISLKGIYPTHRDINNLIHTEIHSHCEYALREIKREVQTSNYLKLSLALYFPN